MNSNTCLRRDSDKKLFYFKSLDINGNDRYCIIGSDDGETEKVKWLGSNVYVGVPSRHIYEQGVFDN